jgi:hypothetical protein
MPRALDSNEQPPWIMPGTAFAFSMLMAFLAPRYVDWFGDALPEFTQRFFSIYPIWIAVSVLAVADAVIGARIPSSARRLAAWRALDLLLGVTSVIIITGGVVALFLPILAPAGRY